MSGTVAARSATRMTALVRNGQSWFDSGLDSEITIERCDAESEKRRGPSGGDRGNPLPIRTTVAALVASGPPRRRATTQAQGELPGWLSVPDPKLGGSPFRHAITLGPLSPLLTAKISCPLCAMSSTGHFCLVRPGDGASGSAERGPPLYAAVVSSSASHRDHVGPAIQAPDDGARARCTAIRRAGAYADRADGPEAAGTPSAPGDEPTRLGVRGRRGWSRADHAPQPRGFREDGGSCPASCTGWRTVSCGPMCWGLATPAPLLLAPVGAAGLVRGDSDVLIARGAAAAGVPYVFSNQGCNPMEQTAQAMGVTPFWYQLYWSTDEDLVDSMIRRAEACGASALVVTVDTTLLGWRPQDLEPRLAALRPRRGDRAVHLRSSVHRHRRAERSSGPPHPGRTPRSPSGRSPRCWRCLAEPSRPVPGRQPALRHAPGRGTDLPRHLLQPGPELGAPGYGQAADVATGDHQGDPASRRRPPGVRARDGRHRGVEPRRPSGRQRHRLARRVGGGPRGGGSGSGGAVRQRDPEPEPTCSSPWRSAPMRAYSVDLTCTAWRWPVPTGSPGDRQRGRRARFDHGPDRGGADGAIERDHVQETPSAARP